MGIAAGLNASAVTVAITQTGNALGLSPKVIADLPPGELDARLAGIAQQFREAGAHHLLRSVAELPALLVRLESQ